jgi:hypothetical protein
MSLAYASFLCSVTFCSAFTSSALLHQNKMRYIIRDDKAAVGKYVSAQLPSFRTQTPYQEAVSLTAEGWGRRNR